MVNNVNAINGASEFDKAKFLNSALSDAYDLNQDGKIDEEDYELLGQIINGEETPDTATSLKDMSVRELQNMLDYFNSSLEKLDSKLEKLENDQKEYEKVQKNAERKHRAAQDDYDDSVEQLDKENELLEEMMANFENVTKIIENTNQQIKAEQIKNQNDYDSNVKTARTKAEASYSAQLHGADKNSYINSQVNSVKMTSGNLSNLNYLATTYSNQANSLNSNIGSQNSAVHSANSVLEEAFSNYESASVKLNKANTDVIENNQEIASTKQDISATTVKAEAVEEELASRVQGAGMTGTEVLAKISDAEKKLAIDNNVDLTTCMVAMGADNNWHIYDSSGTSLARKFGSNGGFDIIPSGSGYMSGIKTGVEGENARAIYKFSCVNADLTEGTADWEGACYCTCSPLSFDVNGDGVKTTTTKISYDIDGDGKKDIINDSADWVLAFDKDGDGKVGADGSELFGNNTDLDGDGVKDGFKDGFEALKALAAKEGLIGDEDNVLDEKDLKVLSDKYGLSMKKGYNGEVKSLASLGITEINLAKTNKTTMVKNFDGQHNDLMTQEGAEFVVNGQKRKYADIWNAKH